ncbi:MAG TPA: TRAM domain-containing protein, partial [Acidimicrobiia bacterium]|nr:TRAM domain-containing protein [Acidimicrobiia bacterium]
MSESLRLQPDRMAHGGRAVARHDGQAVFVEGAIPGDVVNARVVKTARRHLEAVADSVIEPSPDRVEPPCPYFGTCGGCQWQYARYPAQLRWKTEITAGQLRHLARLEPEVGPTRAVGPPYGYRNRVDLSVERGRFAFYQAGSHHLIPVDSCAVLAPPLQTMMAALTEQNGELVGAQRVTLRAGIRTGETLGLIDDEEGRLHEEVAGRRLRISSRAFFQNNTDGAEALVAEVSRALAPQEGEVLLDGYAGGGLFAATVGAGLETVAVESDPVAVSDLVFNTDA